MLFLEAEDPERDISIYINSPGGSITAGLAILDTMAFIRPDIVTICVGQAASMAAVLLAMGTKGKRFSLPNSRIMIHQPSMQGLAGQAADIDIYAREILRMRETLNQLLATRRDRRIDRVARDVDRDYIMSPEQGVEYGMIDRVITSRDMAPVPVSKSLIAAQSGVATAPRSGGRYTISASANWSDMDTPKEVSRRNLLASAGAVFTTSLFTGNVKGANDRVAVGYIGLGAMGTRQPGLSACRCRKSCRSRSATSISRHLERNEAAAKKKGFQPKLVKDFREVIADKSIDAVCISTPDHWHAYMTVEACKAGKDVYVEKPACMYVEEGQKMVQAARKYNRVVQAGTMQRSGGYFLKAKELVKSGVLGDVTFCHAFQSSSTGQAPLTAIRRTAIRRTISIGTCGWGPRPKWLSTRTAGA